MTWTYGGAPFAIPRTTQSDIDSVRVLIGDTDTTDQQLQDGEITGFLLNSVPPNVAPDIYQSAMAACIALSGRYARRASMSVGDLSIQWQSVSKFYTDLRKTLQAQSWRHTVPVPYAGGMTQSDKELDEADDDMVQPQFSVGMDDDTTGDSTVLGQGFTQAVPSG